MAYRPLLALVALAGCTQEYVVDRAPIEWTSTMRAADLKSAVVPATRADADGKPSKEASDQVLVNAYHLVPDGSTLEPKIPMHTRGLSPLQGLGVALLVQGVAATAALAVASNRAFGNADLCPLGDANCTPGSNALPGLAVAVGAAHLVAATVLLIVGARRAAYETPAGVAKLHYAP